MLSSSRLSARAVIVSPVSLEWHSSISPATANTIPSGMASGIRELRVWQESVSLAGDVVRALRQGMRRETKCVSEAAMATALAVGSHVADGYARPTSEEQREAYLGAKR